MVKLEQIKSMLPKINMEEKKKILKQIIGENNYKFSFDCNFIGKLIDISTEEILDEMFIQLHDMRNIFYEYDLEIETKTNINFILNNKLEKLAFKASEPIEIIDLDNKSQTKVIVGEKGDIFAKGISAPGPLGKDDLSQKLKALEDEFKDEGYTSEMITEIKLINEANTIEAFINNLETEKSYWNK